MAETYFAWFVIYLTVVLGISIIIHSSLHNNDDCFPFHKVFGVTAGVLAYIIVFIWAVLEVLP